MSGALLLIGAQRLTYAGREGMDTAKTRGHTADKGRKIPMKGDPKSLSTRMQR